jgi:hypothetical protein
MSIERMETLGLGVTISYLAVLVVWACCVAIAALRPNRRRGLDARAKGDRMEGGPLNSGTPGERS